MKKTLVLSLVIMALLSACIIPPPGGWHGRGGDGDGGRGGGGEHGGQHSSEGRGDRH